MRNSKKAAYLCMGIILLATTGCGYSDADSDVSTVDTINYNDVINTNAEENSSYDQNIDNQQDSDEKSSNDKSNNEGSINEESDNEQSADKQADNTQSQSDFELDGNIESIADNSAIINKVFHPSANTSVSYTDDSDKVLVTVYFSEETEFEVWTVKNGGVNGDADTEKQQGSFSDLKQDAHINMTGSYEGNDFFAKHVIIYNFV